MQLFVEISKIRMLILIFHKFCLEHLIAILHTSTAFGLRGGATEILMKIDVQKCQFLAE